MGEPNPLEPGSTVAAASPHSGGDLVEADLRELTGERHGGRLASLLGRLKGIKLPSVSLPKLHKPNVSMPNFEMPSISRPDLSGVGEAIDQNKVGRFLKGSAESYLNKFDPRGKDKTAWRLGIVGGAGSVVAFAEFGATFGLSPALRGITAAAIIHGSEFLYHRLHGTYISRALGGTDFGLAPYLKEGVNKGELRKKVLDLEKSVAAKKLKGQAFVDEYKEKLGELLEPYRQDARYLSSEDHNKLAEGLVKRLLKLGTDYAVVNSTAKSLAAGMSAGSFTAALGEAGVRTLLRGFPGGILSQETNQLPRDEGPAPAAAPGGPAAVPEPVTPGQPPIQPAEVPVTAPPPQEVVPPTPASIPAEAPPAPQPKLPDAVQEKMADMQKTPEYQTGIAAEVGKYLPARDEIVSEALKAKGILPAEVDATSFKAGKEAALHVMEGKGNEIFEAAAKEILANNPDANLSQVTEAAQKAYADWLSTDAAQTQIAEAAQIAVADHLRIEDALAQKVTNGLAASPDWVKDVPLEQGTTAGKILDLTWTPADASVMGANIAANYDLLTDMWGNMAKVHPDLLANGSFPVSLSELNDLVAKAEAGDQEAIKRLRQALHWIPAGSKFRAVAANVSREVLKLAA